MGRFLERALIGVLAFMTASFFLSRFLLEGEDPQGWWNFVPGTIFYLSLFVLLPLVGLAALVAAAVSCWKQHSHT